MKIEFDYRDTETYIDSKEGFCGAGLCCCDCYIAKIDSNESFVRDYLKLDEEYKHIKGNIITGNCLPNQFITRGVIVLQMSSTEVYDWEEY